MKPKFLEIPIWHTKYTWQPKRFSGTLVPKYVLYRSRVYGLGPGFKGYLDP